MSLRWWVRWIHTNLGCFVWHSSEAWNPFVSLFSFWWFWPNPMLLHGCIPRVASGQHWCYYYHLCDGVMEWLCIWSPGEVGWVEKTRAVATAIHESMKQKRWEERGERWAMATTNHRTYRYPVMYSTTEDRRCPAIPALYPDQKSHKISFITLVWFPRSHPTDIVKAKAGQTDRLESEKKRWGK